MRQIQEVGFVGIGRMGLPMATRLSEAGFRLTAVDRDPARLEALCARAEAVPGGVSNLADCDVLITMLPDGEVVRDVITSPLEDGRALIARMRPGQVLIDMSSSDPHGTRLLAARVEARGASFLDAPVSGGVDGARAGKLGILVGGDLDVLAVCDPIFRALGTYVHLGELGAGHLAKAINNMLAAVGLLAASEALLVGCKAGVEPERLLEALNTSTGRNDATERKLAQHVLSRVFESGYGLDLLSKDAAIAEKLLERAGLTAGLLAQAAATIQQSARRYGSRADHTEIVRLLEEEAGIELRSDRHEG